MKRSEFLKRLGLGIAAIPLAPQFVAATKDAFDGAKAKTLLDDEAGVFPRYVDPQPQEVIDLYHETGDLLYSHYEEPFIHGSWPLRVNDIISIENSDDEYLVTAMHRDPIEGTQMATCTPFKEGPQVRITQDTNVIRYSNLKSEL